MGASILSKARSPLVNAGLRFVASLIELALAVTASFAFAGIHRLLKTRLG
jgi:hypothetical protein